MPKNQKSTKSLPKNSNQNWPQILITELQKNLLLPQEEKDFWIKEIPNLPETVIKLIAEQIQSSNLQIDQFISLALADDTAHEFLNELKSTVQKTAKNINSAKEEEEAKLAEEKIQKQIENL